MVTQYQRWIFEQKKNKKVETLFQMVTSETIHGLHWKTGGSKNRLGHSFFGSKGQDRK